MITVATTGAFGHTSGDGQKQIAVRMPVALWERLKARAVTERKSMQEKVFGYIESGLIVDEEWDEDEPGRHLR